MKILAIETSCDETAIALLEAKGGIRKPQFKILKNLVSSQIKIHRPFGGVVPMLAKREHIRNLPILFKKLLANSFKPKLKTQKSKVQAKSKKFLKGIDLICVTVGPGLEPALWTGIDFAKNLAKEYKKPLLGVNHLDGHLYSSLLTPKSKILFPVITLIVSGGHTTLLLMKNLTHYKKLGETRDDAVGEAFDKVARLLNLPYPGGPEIEKLAKKGNSEAINFPRPMIYHKNYDFSFSGLKTAVLYFLRDHKKVVKADIAASFQAAAFDVLIKKAIRAAEEFKAKSIFVSGGVAASKSLRQEFQKALKPKIQHLTPKLFFTEFPTDNAAMIGAAGYIDYLRRKKYKLEADGTLNL